MTSRKKAAAPAADELCVHLNVLVVACTSYLILSGASTFVPAVTMEAVSEEHSMSLTVLSSLASAGSGLKAVIILIFMGPALDAFGPHTLIHWCLVGSALCNLAIASSPSAAWYVAAFLVNFVFNSLSEQPAFIVLFATFFDKRLGIACTSIASAYSLAGLVLPLVFGPILVSLGWRALWVILAACSLAMAPLACCVLQLGPIALHHESAAPRSLHDSLRAVIRTVVLTNRMKSLVAYSHDDDTAADDSLQERSSTFTGGKLSGSLRRSFSVASPESLLHSLGRSGVILHPDSDSEEEEAAEQSSSSGQPSGSHAAAAAAATAAAAAAAAVPAAAVPAAAQGLATPGRRSPSRRSPSRRSPTPTAAEAINVSFGEAVRTVEFWALMTGAFT